MKKARPDWVRCTQPVDGVERLEAFFGGKAYAMHRHDTYAIGATLAGVQNFRYRRSLRNGLPGNVMVLHPDEPHDGQAGTEQGFGYRMVYVEPALVQQALGGRPLPFLESGISADPRLVAATQALLRQAGHAIDPLAQHGAIAEVARALAAVTGMSMPARKGDFAAACRARDFLRASIGRHVGLAELEAAAGRDRWSLSHDFRMFFGTSPYRYLTMRRLDAARGMLLGGVPLAHAAVATGFADQSHLTRHFVKAYGQTPGRWLRSMRDASMHGLHTNVQYGQDWQA